MSYTNKIKRRYLNQKEASIYSGLSEIELSVGRSRDLGPTFVKFQDRVLFDVKDLDKFMDDRKYRIDEKRESSLAHLDLCPDDIDQLVDEHERRYLNHKEASIYSGLSEIELLDLTFVKFQDRVLFDVKDLDKFMDDRKYRIDEERESLLVHLDLCPEDIDQLVDEHDLPSISY